MKKVSFALLAATLAGSLAVTTAEAQIVSVTVRGGFFEPVGSYDHAQVEAGELLRDREGTFAFGGSINLAPPLSPFGVRVTTDYVTGSTLSQDGVTEGTDHASDARTLYIAGDLIFAPLPRLLVLEPYLLGGAGYRHIAFDPESLPAFSDGDFVGHFGVGLDLGLGGVGIVAEVTDYVARGNIGASALEHDLFVTAGVRIPIF